MDPNSPGYNKPFDLDAIASELNFWWDYGQLSPQQQDIFNNLMEQILDSGTMNMFDAAWQEIEYYDDDGYLFDVEYYNPIMPEQAAELSKIEINSGYYDGLGGGGSMYGGMFSGDGFDYIFSDYHQGKGSEFCPANGFWIDHV